MSRQQGWGGRMLPLMGALAAVWASGSAYARPELSAVNVLPNGEYLQIELQLSETAPEAAVFALETPPRISIDLPDTGVALKERRIAIQQGAVQSLTAIETSDRSRIVLNLNSLPPYTVRSEGTSVFIDLQGEMPAPITPAAAATLGGTQPGIVSMDFRRSETGAGRLLVELSDDQSDVDIRNEGGKIVAIFKNTTLDDALITRMDVLDFATPVKFIDTTRDGIHTRVTLTPVAGAEFEQVAYQLGRTFTVELQPLTKRQLEEMARKAPQYSGERLNVNFQNIEVRALLQIIADVAGKNLVTSDSVGGSLTLRLENVPWDQALDIVLRTKGLSKDDNGNVIWVAPTEEVAAQQKKEIEAQTQAEQLAPLVTEMVQVNYAKAVDLAALFTSDKAASGGEEASFLSARGRVSVDERTNTLIIRDTREKLEDLQRLVNQLDVPVRQVLIESRLVVANDDFSRSVGSTFGYTGIETSGSTLIGTSGTLAGAATVTSTLAPAADVLSRTNSVFSADVPSGRAAGFGVSILGSDFLLDLELQALQVEGSGEVVSNPRVITADGKEAMIEQGEEIPYISTSAAGSGGQTQFKKAVLGLRVTPQITPDNRVIMDLEVSKDSRGAPAAGGQPAINTSSVTTQVLVNNAETVVLGGIFEQTRLKSTNKVPILGDIPLLGYLFRNNRVDNNKKELLIFITPKILSQGLNDN